MDVSHLSPKSNSIVSLFISFLLIGKEILIKTLQQHILFRSLDIGILYF